ncbi:uncharacterized protein ANIA_10742 [Aspergillus nidulans FGSC A4]|uniref:Uncharacterized protein n=1 Tax=Emericella nidulans (strain FGSC A4 / ATCC 38163 / CBS 112.46 / NRRL 194 / M139) TaxID=227321 RepID=C8UZY2_EMENI|nr:hypothetical protein [Aspergillus nidulans FGSC A4]CBF70663.1 TPA: hypothetical protein ANIA_10742 [Aspergillus nidulans FGSC A4]
MMKGRRIQDPASTPYIELQNGSPQSHMDYGPAANYFCLSTSPRIKVFSRHLQIRPRSNCATQSNVTRRTNDRILMKPVSSIQYISGSFSTASCGAKPQKRHKSPSQP